MQTTGARLGRQELVWILGSLCSLFRIPFDPKLAEQEYPPLSSVLTLHEAARGLGLKTGEATQSADWQKLPLPAVAFLRAVPEVQVRPDVASIPVLILKTDGHKLLFFRAGSQTPETLTVDEARLQFEPGLILVAREALRENDPVPGFEAEKNG